MESVKELCARVLGPPLPVGVERFKKSGELYGVFILCERILHSCLIYIGRGLWLCLTDCLTWFSTSSSGVLQVFHAIVVGSFTKCFYGGSEQQ